MRIYQGMQDNNPPGKLGKGNGREMPGGRLNKLFLCFR